MKIAFILPALKNVGPTIVVYDIICNIIHIVDKVDVYYFDESNDDLEFLCPTYKINFFNKIDFDTYDVVHSHMFRPDLYVWYHRKKSNRCKFVSTLHQNIFDNLKDSHDQFTGWFFEKIWIYALKKQDFIVYLTKNLQDRYKNKLNLSNTYIYNGRNMSNHSNKVQEHNDLEQLKEKNTLIGTHCRVSARKGIHQIIPILHQFPTYKLLIIGDGEELNNVKHMSEELGVSQQCLFLGYKKNATDYLKYLDYYIMPSYSEGFALSLIEAAQNKLPIICSDIDSFREAFDSTEVCFFEVDNQQSLTEAIKFAEKNKRSLSEKSYKKASTLYTATVMSENYLELYKKLINS